MLGPFVALSCGQICPMSPSWVSVFHLLIMAQYCGQQSQAGARTNADSRGPLDGPETDPGDLGTSKAEPSLSLKSQALRERAGLQAGTRGAWEAVPVPAHERQRRVRRLLLLMLPSAGRPPPHPYCHGLPEPSLASPQHHLAEVLISK